MNGDLTVAPSAGSEHGPLQRLLRIFLSRHWAVVLVLAVCFTCLGAIGQWVYARAGLDLEALLLTRLQPAARPPTFGQTLTLAILLGSAGVFASAVIGFGVLRLVGGTRAPFGSVYRVTAFTAVGALAKLIPFIGYFVALVATFWVSVVAVRAVFRLKTPRAVGAVALIWVCTILVLLLAASLRLRSTG